MSGDPISDYFSLAPASATAYFRYTSSSSSLYRPQQPVPPQPVRSAPSSNGIHRLPRARYTGPVTAPQYGGNLSALSQQHWPPRDQAVTSAANPIDLTKSRQSCSTSGSTVAPTLHHYQQHQEQTFGATPSAVDRPTDLSVLLKSSSQTMDTFNSLLQQQLRNSGAASRASNPPELAQLLQSNTQAVSTFNALMQQQLLGTGATTTSAGNLSDLARFLKPSVFTLNGLSPSSQEAGATATATSSNQIDLTASLRSNTPVVNALYRRLRDAKLQSLDGLCVIQLCEKRARTRGLCKLHGGGKRCSVDGCTRGSATGGLCIRHGGGARCSEEGCDNAAQSHGRCKAHGGGLRCQAEGCNKCSQGNGFCRQHGGGRWCTHEGCKKGAQRDGLCSTHGGARFCQFRDCKKQDRGGGFCVQHGGGKRCEVSNCKRSSRVKGKCSDHNRRLQEATAKESRATREPPMDQSTTSSAEPETTSAGL